MRESDSLLAVFLLFYFMGMKTIKLSNKTKKKHFAYNST